MGFPDRKTVEWIRRMYPAGCRVVLDRMDDAQAPPIGSQGTVTFVDDAGSIGCNWDSGGSLSVVYGEDGCHRVATEAEARVTLDWFGRHQPEQDAPCPRCGARMPGKLHRHAVSRWADIMVCDACGTAEALEQAGLNGKKPLMEWAALQPDWNGGAS